MKEPQLLRTVKDKDLKHAYTQGRSPEETLQAWVWLAWRRGSCL